MAMTKAKSAVAPGVQCLQSEWKVIYSDPIEKLERINITKVTKMRLFSTASRTAVS